MFVSILIKVQRVHKYNRIINIANVLQGVPKKIQFKPIFEFLTFGGVFLGVKNNFKNFGNKKNIRLFSKILSKWTLFCSKSSIFLEFSFLTWSEAHKTPKFLHFSDKQCPFTQNFAKQPTIFFVLKVLRIVFYP